MTVTERDERKAKAIDVLFDYFDHAGDKCELCGKLGFACPVEIPEDPPSDFNPDFSKCIFKETLCKTLTIEP